jgi:hypothetical protein
MAFVPPRRRTPDVLHRAVAVELSSCRVGGAVNVEKVYAPGLFMNVAALAGRGSRLRPSNRDRLLTTLLAGCRRRQRAVITESLSSARRPAELHLRTITSASVAMRLGPDKTNAARFPAPALVNEEPGFFFPSLGMRTGVSDGDFGGGLITRATDVRHRSIDVTVPADLLTQYGRVGYRGRTPQRPDRGDIGFIPVVGECLHNRSDVTLGREIPGGK